VSENRRVVIGLCRNVIAASDGHVASVAGKVREESGASRHANDVPTLDDGEVLLKALEDTAS
jgi:hypothetical protein